MLQEVERNLQDAMAVARNVMLEPRLVPGGGAVEMALGHVSASVPFPVCPIRARLSTGVSQPSAIRAACCIDGVPRCDATPRKVVFFGVVAQRVVF